MIGTVEDLTTVEENSDLAVVMADGRIEKWRWAGGLMHKDGNHLPPFFFSGLVKDQKVMLGNFAPPVRGEWFRYQTRDEWRWLVVEVLEGDKFRTGHFRRGNFYDWRDMTQEDLLSTCVRDEGPDWATPQYLDMATRAAEENKARVSQERQNRNIRDARNNVRYARDYLNAAIESMDRR